MEDGARLTTIGGELERCHFFATMLIDSDAPLYGSFMVKAVASRDGMSGDTTGSVSGFAYIRVADEMAFEDG